MAKDSDLEYAEVCLTIRHYSGLRFATRTLFLAISVGLAVVGFGIVPHQSFLGEIGAKVLGFFMTGFFWVAERNMARYMAHLHARALQLEETLGYRLWSGIPRLEEWSAFVTAVVYACLALFWLGALIVAR